MWKILIVLIKEEISYYQMMYAQFGISIRKKDPYHLWDFDIQTDPQILARRPDIVLIKKEKLFAV